VRQIFVLALLASLGLAAGCGGNGSTPAGVPTGGNGTGNVLTIAVDGGPNPTQNGLYTNGAFASATICAPGSTSNCVTVDHLLVDTGSFGVRVLQAAIPALSLPAVNASNGSQAYDCAGFADGSFLWGPVQLANVTLAGETASNVPIQVVENPTTFSIPTSCSNGATNEDTQASLGANGILGVGLEPFDCGTACSPANDGGAPPSTAPAYFTCTSGGCTAASVSCGSECNDSSNVGQVTNPVVAFSVDNNGVIVKFPSVSGSAATLTGSLIFGVGTESNNQLANANVYTLACDRFDTVFEGQSLDIDASSCSGPGSFIDSGSNGYFFPDVNNVLPACPANSQNPGITSFYCPSSLTSLSAVNYSVDPTTGTPGFNSAVSFSIDNANTLFSSGNAALGTLGGVQPAGAGFDYGLPFFYGKSVYSTIDGQAVPSGLAASPWWAY
jgi:Protein of unknown function (DUF3443)